MYTGHRLHSGCCLGARARFSGMPCLAHSACVDLWPAHREDYPAPLRRIPAKAANGWLTRRAAQVTRRTRRQRRAPAQPFQCHAPPSATWGLRPATSLSTWASLHSGLAKWPLMATVGFRNRKRTRADDLPQEHRPNKRAKSRGGLHLHGPPNFPPEFWDNLSKVWLTRRALRELDRRNNAQPPSAPVASAPAVFTSDLARFSRHGGPNLRHLRGVCMLAI